MDIRRPVVGDADGVGRAWEDARHLYSQMDSQTFLPPNPDDLQLGRVIVESLIAGAELPNRWVRVAAVDGEPAGFITATLHEPEDDSSRDIIRDSTRRHIKIDILVVQQAHAGSGVGRMLAESVEAWAGEVGASLLKVGTHVRSPAVGFYEALGYGRRSVIFEKYLD